MNPRLVAALVLVAIPFYALVIIGTLYVAGVLQ